MGRYAFFNTGLEYKFRFGVQPSEDITLFGGESSDINFEGGYGTQTWDAIHFPEIEKGLKRVLEWLGEEPVNWDIYEKSLKGTHDLYDDLYNLYKKDHREDLVARYILGCLIYHQLLYYKVVQADYEG